MNTLLRKGISVANYIVLVIDDAPETLGMVSDALEDEGMTVLVARSGQEGLKLAQRVNPDVILLDAVMPEMDGFETCRRLKATPTAQAAPVIFMTGLTDSAHLLTGLDAGGVDYVTKPVVVDELIARIVRHVMNARAIQSARTALEYSGQSVIAVLRDGQFSWGTPRSVALLDDVSDGPLFDAGMAVPALRQWLDEVSRLPVSQGRLFRHGATTLFVIGHSEEEVILQLNRSSGNSSEQRLEAAFDLTTREAEVLLWLSYGKTNRDIADILSVSARTVNKHLEQIFHKLGVDNRTSAAVKADRILQSEGGVLGVEHTC